MNRRQFLALLGAGMASISGCTGTSGNERAPTESTSTRTPGPTARTTTRTETTEQSPTTPGPLSVGDSLQIGEGRITLSDTRTQHSVFYLLFPDQFSVAAADETQYLFASVGTETIAPRLQDFTLELEGDPYRPVSSVADEPPSHVEHEFGREYSAQRGSGWMAFELPGSVETPEGAVVVDLDEMGTARWRLPAETATRLRAPPPEFALDSLDVPDRVEGNTIPVSIAVENRGDGPGTFRAVLENASQTASRIGKKVEWQLDPGSRRSNTEVVVDTSESPEVTVQVHWEGGRERFTVEMDRT